MWVKHSAHLKRNICVTKFKMSSHVMNEWRILFKKSLHSKSRESSQRLESRQQRLSLESVFRGTFNESKWGRNLGQTVHFAQR